VEIEHLTDKRNLNLAELLHVDIFAVGGDFAPAVREMTAHACHLSLFAMQPFEPSDGCLALRKLMANG
jgi:hypothetical protein